jgi:phosphonate transport system permease protein
MDPAPPRVEPPRRGRSGRRLVLAVLAIGILVASWIGADAHLSALLDPRNLRALGRLLGGFAPPELSPRFMVLVAAAAWRTVAIAAAGTVLSILWGIPLGVLASLRLWRSGPLAADAARPARLLATAMCVAARALLRFFRAVPDVAWALFFVVGLGLGPLPGTLAIGISNAGVLGRVAGDLFDAVPDAPVQALRAAGASRAQVFVRAVWPQAALPLGGYIVYTFECAARAAAVLGLVGAGGLGQEIGVSLRLFEYGEVATLLVALLAVLLVGEWGARRARVAIERRGPPGPRWRRVVAGLAVAVFGILSLREAGFVLALADPGTWSHLGGFLAGLWPPDLEPGFLVSLVGPTFETLAVAVLGSAIGITIGAALALPAASVLALPAPGEPGRRGPGVVAYASARGALAALRSIPELVWVPICVVAVGLGPFAGAIALGLHTGGVLGRLYAEALEDAPPAAPRALAAAGAGPFQRLLFALVPLARPTLEAYTLLRFEANLRAATVVGLLGGGGLGLLLSNSLQLGFYARAATLVTVVWITVGVADWLANGIRVEVGRDGELFATRE